MPNNSESDRQEAHIALYAGDNVLYVTPSFPPVKPKISPQPHSTASLFLLPKLELPVEALNEVRDLFEQNGKKRFRVKDLFPSHLNNTTNPSQGSNISSHS
jgi:hypothetical protein